MEPGLTCSVMADTVGHGLDMAKADNDRALTFHVDRLRTLLNSALAYFFKSFFSPDFYCFMY